jgi:histidinol-phosphate aminotransferase
MSLPFELNPNLAEIPVYQPGRPIEEVAREQGLPPRDIIKLASNENPLGPSPAAVAAIQQSLQTLHLYPDGNAFYLKNKLAERLGVDASNLILGNGSNEIIEFIGHAIMRPGTADRHKTFWRELNHRSRAQPRARCFRDAGRGHAEYACDVYRQSE